MMSNLISEFLLMPLQSRLIIHDFEEASCKCGFQNNEISNVLLESAGDLGPPHSQKSTFTNE